MLTSINRSPIAIFLLVFCLASAARAERMADYGEALDRAKSSGRPILVYQYGSDWNRLSMRLLASVWNSPELAKALDGYLLVAVDQPEAPGGRALAAEPDASQRPGRAELPPNDQLKQRTADELDGAGDLLAVQSAEGSTWSRRPDGAFLAAGPNPANDVLTLSLKAETGGRLLRLDFPTDESLPGAGPGRAGNGNFVINEVTVALPGGSDLPLAGAWANDFEGASNAQFVIDGRSDDPKACWNARANTHQRRTLLIALKSAIAAGSMVKVELTCRSAWGQHVPGCIRAVLQDVPDAADAVTRYAQAQKGELADAAFRWRGVNCPRIALMDAGGRHVASFDNPRADLTVAALVAEVRELRAILDRRDALWAEAARASGPARAELLRQGLDLMKLGNSQGQDSCYAAIHDDIRTADPDDVSGCQRWLQFSQDSRNGCGNLSKAVDEKSAAKDFPGALQEVDTLLADPRNNILDHDRRQRLMMLKFHICRQWPGHEEERFAVLKEIADLDATTYFGIGATGYLEMHHRTETPGGVTYGWTATQVKVGANHWRLHLDGAKYFDHNGSYDFQMFHTGGKATMTVSRIELRLGERLLASVDTPGVLAPGGKITARLQVSGLPPGANPELHIDFEASAADCAGRFAVEPLLDP